MDTKERLDALEVALNNEMREREFYLKHAERTENPVGKAMFKQIADEELEHYERIMELQKKWKSNDQWPETVPLRVKETNVKNVLKEIIQKVKDMPESDDDDRRAIETAIEFEARGASYYSGLRDEVSDTKEKAFFDLLAGIEHEHWVSLKDTQEYLTNPAAWYTRSEHHSLDG